jgi:Bacteriocin-protection, YdeI or OmpD-Associated
VASWKIPNVRFRGVIEAAGRGGATVPLPFDPKRSPAVLERDREAAQAFETLSHTHRREYARWISEAKRPQTKERRVAKAAAMLRSGTRSPEASSTVEEGRPK